MSVGSILFARRRQMAMMVIPRPISSANIPPRCGLVSSSRFKHQSTPVLWWSFGVRFACFTKASYAMIRESVFLMDENGKNGSIYDFIPQSGMKLVISMYCLYLVYLHHATKALFFEPILVDFPFFIALFFVFCCPFDWFC